MALLTVSQLSKQLHDPHRVPTKIIYTIGEKKPEKKSASMGFEPMTSVNTGAMLYRLSYEATHLEPGHFVGSILPMKEIDERILK